MVAQAEPKRTRNVELDSRDADYKACFSEIAPRLPDDSPRQLLPRSSGSLLRWIRNPRRFMRSRIPMAEVLVGFAAPALRRRDSS